LKPNGQRDYQTLHHEVMSVLNTICAGGKIKIILTYLPCLVWQVTKVPAMMQKLFLSFSHFPTYIISLAGSLVKHSHIALWFCAHNLTTNTVRVSSFTAAYSGHMKNWQLQLYIQITAKSHHRWKQNPQFFMCLNYVHRLVAVHKETLQKTRWQQKSWPQFLY